MGYFASDATSTSFRFVLHPFRNIYDHNDTVDRRQSTIGIFRKIFVAGVSQNVDLAVSVFKEPAITEVATGIPLCNSMSMKSEVACFNVLMDLTAPAIWMAPPNNKVFL